MSLKSSLLHFLLIFFFIFLLFYPSLSYYFFQDDWFVLNWVNTGNLLSFFEFRTDIIYWRPLTMPVFFAIGKTLFGLNPVGFHLIAFTFQIINSILVYIFYKELKLSSAACRFASFIYAVSAFHFIGLSWLSTTSYVAGTTFILSAIISFLRLKFTLSFVFFLIALASTEFSILYIPLILLLKKFSKNTLFQLLPHITTVLIYLTVRFLFFSVPAQGDYGLSLNLTTLANMSWYLLWTFNFAEKFSTIFFVSNLKDYPNLIFSQIKYLIFPTILIISSIIFVLISKINKKEIILFGSSWFLIGLSPVILIPKHTYPVYLIIASLGIIYILAGSLDSFKKSKILVMTIISLIWFISSCLTLDFTRKTHWIANQQAISRAYSNYLKNTVSQPKDYSVFIIKPADVDYATKNSFTLVETEQNVKQSLNDQDGVQVIYENQTLKSIFANHQESVKTPQGVSTYEISPRIEK